MNTIFKMAKIGPMVFLCVAVFYSATVNAQNVTLQIKDNSYAELYFPSLSAHFPTSGLQASDKTTNFIESFSKRPGAAKPDNQGVITMTDAVNPYYKLDRLQLYMLPGTVLTADLKDKRNPWDVKFYGKDAEANIWLNQYAFTAALPLTDLNTSFDTLKTYKDYSREILSHVDLVRNELQKLKADTKFKLDGSIRLNFTAIHALLNYWRFSVAAQSSPALNNHPVQNKKMEEVASNFYLAKHDSIMRDVVKLLPVEYHTAYNDFPEVINALGLLLKFDSTAVTEKKFPGFIELHNLMNEIAAQKNNFFYSNRIGKMLGYVRDPELKEILGTWQKEYAALQPKVPAIDLILRDTAGNTIKLSDFKGKALYLDVWATWCGPCIQLKPEFEKLALQYQNSGITFIAISTDKNMAQWKAYQKMHKDPLNVKQYIVADEATFRQEYKMEFIPRFLLIDSGFTFISAQAPAPYQPEIYTLLKQLKTNL